MRTVAITHVPSPKMHECLRSEANEPINLERARAQHAAYCELLERCGAHVRTLESHGHLPDCVFVEDTAVVLDELAVICSMGHPSRRDEPAGIEPELRRYRPVKHIQLPAKIDGGDVLRVGRRILVGQSTRTDSAGIAALEALVAPFGYQVQPVEVRGCLHLKSACTALPNETLLINPQWLDTTALRDFDTMAVPDNEPHAANVLLLGETVCAPAAHQRTVEAIRGRGFRVETVDVSEFAKADGCMTCLSLLVEG